MPNLAQKMLNDIRAERIRQARIKVPTRELKVPRNLENSYASKLRAYQKEINRQLLDALQPLIDTYRQDATTEQIETVTKGAGVVIGEAIATGAVLSNLIQSQGLNVLNWNDKKYSADFYTILGFNAIPPEYRSEALQSWTKENIQLIKNVNDEQISKIETLMLRSSRDGTVKTNLTKEITKIMGSSIKRATLIATDQVLKLNGQIDRLKQSEAGITHFIWRTVGDERVRTKHRQFSGNKYPWKGGANGIYPGKEVRCRCWAEPSFEEILGPEYKAAPAQPIKPKRT